MSFWGCKWCGGRTGGCLYCEAEADRQYKEAFPDGPKPIATFDTSSEDGLKKLSEFFGPELTEKLMPLIEKVNHGS